MNEIKKITIKTNVAQQLGIAIWLQGPWQGSEEDLYILDEIAEGFRTEDFTERFIYNAQGQAQLNSKDLDFKKESEVTISDEAARRILSHYAPSATPAAFGRSKVALLRSLRAAVPVETEKK